jgi:NlpC/P60 family
MTDLVPGDLVFFNTRKLQFSHVGIYIGEDRFIHAPRRGGEVEVVTLSQKYWQKHFDGARRLIGALPNLIPTAEAASSTAVVGPPEPEFAPVEGAASDRSPPEERAP